MPESRWEDYVLYHMEPFFEGREQQIEIVLEKDHNLFLGSFLLVFLDVWSAFHNFLVSKAR